jgi:hypothetical protein
VPRSSAVERATELISRHRDPQLRCVDLGLDVVDAAGELLLGVGGRWDRVERRYVGEATAVREIRAHGGQLEFMRFYAAWLGQHLGVDEAPDLAGVYSALLHGGQRAGKTFAAVAVAIAYALAVPGAIVWLVAPAEPGWRELETVIDELLPREWATRLGSSWEVVTGSSITLRSAHNPEALKLGRADLIVMNEAQSISERAFAICRGRIADRGGLVIGCANPPTKAIGEWVADFVAECEAGDRQAREFFFDPRLNEYIDIDALLSMAHEVDRRTFETEVLGKILSIGDVVLPGWDRRIHEISPGQLAGRLGIKQLVDITCEATALLEGQPFDRVVGLDFQRRPMVAVEFKLFENPRAPYSRADREGVFAQHAFAFITGEIVLEGDEDDLALAMIASGWDPGRTFLVADASGVWQFSERDPKLVDELRDKVKGRGSWDVVRRHGFHAIGAPDRDQARNPDIVERCRATAARIETAAAGAFGQHFLFAHPSCKRATAAIRKWENVHGKPSRKSRHAHLGDAITYVVQRLWPRRYINADQPITIIERPSSMGLRGGEGLGPYFGRGGRATGWSKTGRDSRGGY